MKSVELFAGAGGLALGASLAGFAPLAVIEWDKWACDTIRENQERGNPLVTDWPLYESDVRLFDFSGITEEIDLSRTGHRQKRNLAAASRTAGERKNLGKHARRDLSARRKTRFCAKNRR